MRTIILFLLLSNNVILQSCILRAIPFNNHNGFDAPARFMGMGSLKKTGIYTYCRTIKRNCYGPGSIFNVHEYEYSSGFTHGLIFYADGTVFTQNIIDFSVDHGTKSSANWGSYYVKGDTVIIQLFCEDYSEGLQINRTHTGKLLIDNKGNLIPYSFNGPRKIWSSFGLCPINNDYAMTPLTSTEQNSVRFQWESAVIKPDSTQAWFKGRTWYKLAVANR